MQSFPRTSLLLSRASTLLGRGAFAGVRAQGGVDVGGALRGPGALLGVSGPMDQQPRRGMAGKKTEGIEVLVDHAGSRSSTQATNEALRKLDDMSDSWFLMKRQRERRWREQPSKVRNMKREAGEFRRFRRKLETLTRAVLREHELREKRK